MKLPTVYLFVPGDRPDRFDKALASGADAIVIDLEDAVAPERKAAARADVRRWVDTRPDERVLVRINDASTPWFDGDLALVCESGLRAVMLPKVESPGQVDAAREAIDPSGSVVPLIETARGVRDVEAIAAASGVSRLAFGTLDYAVDLGLSGDARGLIEPASRIAIASRCAGIASPIAGVTTAIDDEARLRADVAFDRALGFGAKLCIHPRQVAAVRQAFAPTPEEIEWARRVLAVAKSGGAAQVDGRMVDRPVVLRAQALLDRAG
jgi:citrate lyase subunit beta/citryl-CoA lyase